jgi:uncharacterized membrane protein YbhN (UPF0104 family)
VPSIALATHSDSSPVPRAGLPWKRLLGLTVPFVALAALIFVIAQRRDVFFHAINSAPVWLLLLAVVLQLVALLSRSEAWRLCVGAAGSTIPRRGVFRASGIGGLVGIVNGATGVAARIATLRRSAPAQCPHVGPLVAAEVPIVAIEIALAALTSFTLLGPLGLPWWSAVVCVTGAGAGVLALNRLSKRRTTGFWSGLAVLRTLEGRGRVFGLVIVAVFCQIARNYLALHAIGVDASVFDSIAVLIAMITLSQLPIGPSVGAAAVVVILGTHGVALTAAAGVLLSATGMAGTLCFGGWALAEKFLPTRTAWRTAL